jgi:hypothetical protein
VSLDVVLSRLLRVFGRLTVMSVSHMSMVGGCFVVFFHVMLCGFVVMARSVLMVFRCLGVMMGCFLRH